MAIQLNVQQADVDASWRLLQRMLTGNERDLPNLVFGTTELPMPAQFHDPQHPFTKYLVDVVNRNMVAFTTYVTVGELHLDPNQVDQLQVQDPRVVALKQRVKDEVAKISTVAELRAERIRIMNHFN
jgi:hypothetical protein